MALSLLENILKDDYEEELGGPGGKVVDCGSINLQAIFWKLLMTRKILCKANEIVTVKYTAESYCICGGSTIAANLRSQE